MNLIRFSYRAANGDDAKRFVLTTRLESGFGDAMVAARHDSAPLHARCVQTASRARARLAPLFVRKKGSCLRSRGEFLILAARW